MSNTTKLDSIPEEVGEKTEYTDFVDKLEETNELGTGGFGTVNLYKKTDDNKLFAVKLIQIDEKNTKERIEREIQILKYIKDDSFCEKNSLCYRGYQIVDDTYYILTDYAGEEYKPLNIENGEVDIKVIENIYEAIRNLHKKGVAHLDIKPDNILVNKNNHEIILIDFGISCNYIKENKNENIKENKNENMVFCPSNKKELKCTTQFLDYRLLKDLTDRTTKKNMQNYMNADLWALGIIISNVVISKSIFYLQKGLETKLKNNYDIFKEYKDKEFGYWVYHKIYISKTNTQISENIYNTIKGHLTEDEIKIDKYLSLSKILPQHIYEFFKPTNTTGGKNKKTKKQKNKKKRRTKKKL
jgi:serine/threonine protein kinase